MYNVDDLMQVVENGNAAITDADREEIQQFHNGRALQQLVIMPGWEVLMDTFNQKKQDAIEELLSINPGDKELVLAAHAVAYAVHKTLDNLTREVVYSIEAAKRLPDVLQERLNVKATQYTTEPL
jgi:hypothetical protein